MATPAEEIYREHPDPCCDHDWIVAGERCLVCDRRICPLCRFHEDVRPAGVCIPCTREGIAACRSFS